MDFASLDCTSLVSPSDPNCKLGWSSLFKKSPLRIKDSCIGAGKRDSNDHIDSTLGGDRGGDFRRGSGGAVLFDKTPKSAVLSLQNDVTGGVKGFVED